jgi:hypothetical protein
MQQLKQYAEFELYLGSVSVKEPVNSDHISYISRILLRKP